MCKTVSSRSKCIMLSLFQVTLVLPKDTKHGLPAFLTHQNKNIKAINVDFEALAEGTPCEGLLASSELRESPHRFYHTAEIVQLLMMHEVNWGDLLFCDGRIRFLKWPESYLCKYFGLPSKLCNIYPLR